MAALPMFSWRRSTLRRNVVAHRKRGRGFSLRRPGWRTNHGDWGLPPLAPMDDVTSAARDLLAALSRLALGPRDSRRLRRSAGRRAPLRISLGSDRRAPDGWISTDLVRHPPEVLYLDLRRDFPFHDGSVDGILAEHVLEHLSLDDVVRLLPECARVLKVGAPMRVVSPDAELIADIIHGVGSARVEAHMLFDHELHRWQRNAVSRWRVVNRLSHQWGMHEALLSYELMELLMLDAGFQEITRCELDQTVHFEAVPGTHLARYPGARHEAFVIEGRRG